VLALAADANLLVLILRVHLLLERLDFLDERFALIFGNAGTQRDDLPDGAAGGRFDFPELEGFDVHAALDRLALQDVDDVAHFQLVVGDEGNLLLVGFDARLAVTEIETIFDLLARLVQRVVQLLPVDARHDVERCVGGHLLARYSYKLKARSATSPILPSLPTSFPSTKTSTPPALPTRTSAFFPWNVLVVPAGNVPSMLTLPSTVTLSHEGAESTRAI